MDDLLKRSEKLTRLVATALTEKALNGNKIEAKEQNKMKSTLILINGWVLTITSLLSVLYFSLIWYLDVIESSIVKTAVCFVIIVLGMLALSYTFLTKFWEINNPIKKIEKENLLLLKQIEQKKLKSELNSQN